MIVRTVTKPNAKLMDTYDVPENVPIHVHMFSLHNTMNIWTDPKDFKPERWLGGDDEEEDDVPKCPRWPFVVDGEQGNPAEGAGCPYDGAGHGEGELTYFPFSAGPRICSGRLFALHVLRRTLTDISKTYRLNPSVALWEDDRGYTVNATIMPALKASTEVVVRRRGAEKEDEGWADEEDEDEDNGNDDETNEVEEGNQ